MRFLLPQGIGDSIWGMTKVQSIAKKFGSDVIQIFLNSRYVDDKESRAVPFISNFRFVHGVGQYRTGILKDEANPTDGNGHYVYLDSGPSNLPGIDYVVMPNQPLERGIRLEDWLPEFDTNWHIMREFQFEQSDVAAGRAFSTLQEFCVFFLGSTHSNTADGHNRGPIWKPEDWAWLGRRIQESLGLSIAVVGAEYDRPYWLEYVEPLVRDQSWLDLVGKCRISETFGFISSARFVISFQSGIGIVATFMGIPTGIFWRAKGDSISPYFMLSFEEAMASAWVPPEMIQTNRHLPLIYGRHTVDYIMAEIKNRGW